MSELHIKPEPGTTELNHHQTSLSGKLPDPIATKEWNIEGGITTAVDAYLNRSKMGAVDPKNSHFTVNVTDQTIQFQENENMEIIRKTYKGSLKPSREILKLQINEEKPISLPELRKLLKAHRHLFVNDDLFLTLMQALTSPKLKSEISSNVDTDNKGNKSESHSVKNLESNVPGEFVMRIPLFAADTETFATVNVELLFMHEKAQQATFWMESFDLQKAEIEAAEKIISGTPARAWCVSCCYGASTDSSSHLQVTT